VKRRDFITLIGGAAAWSVTARGQQGALPVVAYLSSSAAGDQPKYVAAFRNGLGETGYVEGQNVAIEFHWADNQVDRLPALAADLVRRRVEVIATPGSGPAALAAKAATTTIPIVFSIGVDPVQIGLVASLAQPGGNATGINFFLGELVARRLQLLHEVVPKAVRVAALVNPTNTANAAITLRDLQEAAPAIGLKIQVLYGSTSREIDAVFDSFARERPEALFVAPDVFLTSRRVQLATLAARERIPAAYPSRDSVEVGGLMSYGTDVAETCRQVGIYSGRILKGTKPADLPVVQSTKFEFVINLQTARALDIAIPSGVLSIADEVIE
jgi:putative ABC transport system substrate-binding protein